MDKYTQTQNRYETTKESLRMAKANKASEAKIKQLELRLQQFERALSKLAPEPKPKAKKKSTAKK